MTSPGGPACTLPVAVSSPVSRRIRPYRKRRIGSARGRQYLVGPYRPVAATPGQEPQEPVVREMTVKIDTGKVIRILCNDIDASAQEITDLYKRRWAIELFFRWINQTFRIRHFVSTSENAVRIQIAVALIAYLLRPRSPENHQRTARLRSPGANQSHASKANRSTNRSQSNNAEKPKSNGVTMDMIIKPNTSGLVPRMTSFHTKMVKG